MANLLKESRKFTRFSTSIPVTLDDRDEHLSTICSNISQKGVYIETSENLKKGDVLYLHLDLNPSKPAKVLGEVVWTSRTKATDYRNKQVKGFGIRFLANVNNMPMNDGILEKDRWRPSPEKDSLDFQPAPAKGNC